MKFLLRLSGTWMIGLTIILAVIDGTKSLAAGAPVVTSAGQIWDGFDPDGFARFRDMVAGWLEPAHAADLATAIYGWPGWAICGAIGVLLLLGGRKRSKRGYLQLR